MRSGLWIPAGVVVWAMHFTVVYTGAAIACARGVPGPVPWIVGIATAMATLAAAWLVARGLAHRAHFVGWMTAAVAAIGLAAILLEGVPALWIPPCAWR